MSIKLILVGDGRENYFSSNNIPSYIVWKKRVDYHEMDKIYATLDILLNCLLHDSGCMVVLEAMSRGFPVVYIDAGCFKILTYETCALKVKQVSLDEMN